MLVGFNVWFSTFLLPKVFHLLVIGVFIDLVFRYYLDALLLVCSIFGWLFDWVVVCSIACG